MTPPAAAPRSPRFSSRWVTTSSQVLVLLMCLLTLCYGLLPGLLAVCLGYMVTHAMSGEPGLGRRRLPSFWAAAVVIVLPLIGLAVIMVHAQGMLVGAVAQYEALLQHLARTVLEIRQKLPPNLAAHLPDELIAAQAWLAAYLQSQAKALTGFGSAGLQGGLLAYVGLVIGALVVGTPAMDHPAPLRAAMRKLSLIHI